jgi:tRNA-Thr(GGU) m(6)t(6)A37 methyltransferase TsaA
MEPVIYPIDAVGVVHSCFKEKFGIPRQPGLVSEARATIELLPPYNRPEAVRGLEQFTHIWVIFIFHECLRAQWKPTVRPPRLGGNTRIGVFASRATYRPNPIGMSPVELEKVETNNDKVILHLKGVDLLDGTPVIDIKPYIPYADNIPHATGGFAEHAPQSKFEITFSDEAQQIIQQQQQHYPHLQQMITQLLEIDPRPAYKEGDEGRIYGMKLYEFDLKWKIEGERVVVVGL